MVRLLSWNVFNENEGSERIHRCIDQVQPEIVILQEALDEHLMVLSKSYRNIVTGNDYKLKDQMCYLAIATNASIESIVRTSHFADTKAPASVFARWAGWVEFLDSLSALIRVSAATPVRVGNVHLTAGGAPSTRWGELLACEHHLGGTEPCVFAGDFNCFSNPLVAMALALPFSYRARDMVCFEQRRLIRWLGDRGFRSAVRGVTVPWLRMQFDHVFCRDVPGVSARILDDAFGSDHRPIVVDFSQ
jgi:endonuclease/exonuclease/phosphatase (EEP) superfamily protein YafD